MNYEGTEVTHDDFPDMSKEEIKQYIDMIEDEENTKPSELKINSAGRDADGTDLVGLDYKIPVPKFERIRRITGYLVGTINRWNNAKQAEERDRVKHSFNY